MTNAWLIEVLNNLVRRGPEWKLVLGETERRLRRGAAVDPLQHALQLVRDEIDGWEGEIVLSGRSGPSNCRRRQIVEELDVALTASRRIAGEHR